MKQKILTAALSAVALAACSSASEAPTVDTEAEIEAIHAVEQSQMDAIAADNVDDSAAVYAPDAVLIVSGGPAMMTPEAIRASFQAMADDANASLTMTPGAAFVSSSGDLAYTTGGYSYTYTDAASGEATGVSGANMTVWRKIDGEWRIVSDYNVHPVTASDEAAPAE